MGGTSHTLHTLFLQGYSVRSFARWDDDRSPCASGGTPILPWRHQTHQNWLAADYWPDRSPTCGPDCTLSVSGPCRSSPGVPGLSSGPTVFWLFWQSPVSGVVAVAATHGALGSVSPVCAPTLLTIRSACTAAGRAATWLPACPVVAAPPSNAIPSPRASRVRLIITLTSFLDRTAWGIGSMVGPPHAHLYPDMPRLRAH